MALFETPDSHVLPPVTPDFVTPNHNPDEATIASVETPDSHVMPVTPDGNQEAANLLRGLSNMNELWSNIIRTGNLRK